MSLEHQHRLAFRHPNSATDLLSFNKVSINSHYSHQEDQLIGQYNLYWIKEGRADYLIDFTQHQYQGSILFCLSPGEIFKIDAEETQEGYHLAFNDDFYCLDTHHQEIGCNGLLFNNWTGPRHLELPLEVQAEFEFMFRQLERELQQKSLAKFELLQSLLKILLIRCADLKKQQSQFSAATQDDHFFIEFNRLVEKHFRQWHSVKAYAMALELSPITLSKKMALIGKKPSQIIQARIILEAKRALSHSQKSIKEIAFDLGFKDPPHFTKFFQKKTELNPTQFRHSLQAYFR